MKLNMALSKDSQMPLANYAYALSFHGEERPPQSALNAAGYALDYYGGDYKEALPPINRAITWTKDPTMRMAAQTMRQYIKVENKG